jgi:GT2 family glycosyltransferase
MDLSIIIVNWNSKDYLKKCLASVRAETQGLNYEIIVIDSGSFDGCDRLLQEVCPEATFIQSVKNLGFAKANNKAFRATKGRYVLFLNPDTELVGPAINVMYEHLRRLPKAGIIGCRLLNSDHTIQTSCVQSVPTILNQFLDCEFLRARWPKSALWGMSPLYEKDGNPRPAAALAGTCLMLKRDVFQRVGMFSEDYFMYAEDIDLCHKLKQAGYEIYYIPGATIIHHGGGSSQAAASNFSVVMMRESIWRFLKKNRGRAYGSGYRVSMLVSSFVRLVLLMALFPVQRVCRCHSPWCHSFQKWQAILRWSLNRQEWIKQYQ